MVDGSYPRDWTALLFVDPYNDFLSEGGKFWPLVEGVANDVGVLGNLRSITTAIRKAGIQVFIVPHRRWEPGDYEGWAHPSPYQVGSGEKQMFAKGLVGRRMAPQFRPAAGGRRHQGTLGLERLCEHRSGLQAEAAGDHHGDPDRPAGQHLH